MFTTTKSAKNPSVHPHACGVHLLTVSTTTIIFGSSPRMWGTCTVFFLFIGRCRFIPTHVGYIARPLGDNLIITVHPHACGVHIINRELGMRLLGSSPRMWGTCRFSILS